MRVKLFDKSRGLGGRVATRRSDAGAFDHGAQYFTARDAAFRSEAQSWRARGVAARYGGRIVALRGGAATLVGMDEPRYVGTPGMSAIARALAEGLNVIHDCAITGARRNGDGWQLDSEAGPVNERFDVLAIAVPADQAVPLLSAAPALADSARVLPLQPCWALMAAFDARVAVEYDAAFTDHPVLGWVMRDSSKPQRSTGERWVLHANTDWSRANLEREAASVAHDLVAAFAELTRDGRAPRYASAHRWRYAFSPGLQAGCLWDAALKIGAAGDWCADGRVEGAYLSGMQLARTITAQK